MCLGLSCTGELVPSATRAIMMRALALVAFAVVADTRDGNEAAEGRGARSAGLAAGARISGFSRRASRQAMVPAWAAGRDVRQSARRLTPTVGIAACFRIPPRSGGLGDPRAEQRQSERELLKSSVREEEGYVDHCAVVDVTYLPPAGLLGNLCTLQ